MQSQPMSRMDYGVDLLRESASRSVIKVVVDLS